MKLASFVLIAFLLYTTISEAQTTKPKSIYAKQMTFEIGGNIFFTSETFKTEVNGRELGDQHRTTFTLSVNGGIFVIDGLKLGIEPAIQYVDYGHGDNQTQLKLYFAPEYVFNTKTIFYPYIGGSIGYTSIATSSSVGSTPTESGLSWGVKGGGKINAFENALINIGISYYSEAYNYTLSNPVSNSDVKNRWNILGVSAGLSIFFR